MRRPPLHLKKINKRVETKKNRLLDARIVEDDGTCTCC
jgi:hypothetical protein